MIQRSETAALLAIALLLGAVGGAVVTGALNASPDAGTAAGTNGDPTPDTSGDGVTTFESDEEYRAFLEGEPDSPIGAASAPVVRRGERDDAAANVAVDDAADVGTDDVADVGTDDDASATRTADDAAFDGEVATEQSGGTDGNDRRHSGTNVQVEGIDEPDVVKTDGEWVYYSGGAPAWRQHDAETDVLDARTPDAPTVAGSIPTGGDLLRSNDTLVTIGSSELVGYDVADPSSPEERWRLDLNHSVETARLADGRLYLVLRDRPDTAHPCPIRPVADASGAVDEPLPEIPCTEVYRPASAGAGDVTYTALSVDPERGAVGDRVTFAGSGSNTVVYASHDAIYVAYEDSPSELETRLAFLQGPASEHVDDQTLERIEELQSYDLSERAMQVEIGAALDRQRDRLAPDERADFEEAFAEGWEDYVEERKRELLRTGIVRVDVNGSDLAVDETGEVPGRVDEQWALSERDGHLHVATTVNPAGAEWENDLYTLDEELSVADSVTGMGVDQRIYSVRYVEDRAYLVTFRQVDPFYVIDVSDPTDLELLGELKLPGYSDYMHPLESDRILGVGEEDGRVKATVFDASDPTDPVVEDDLQFSDRATAISRDHHAFLLDERHEVFFLPGTEGGHVVDYADGLDRVATVETDGLTQRARYIGDYLYVFGTEELVVLDQTDWSEADRLNLG